MSYPGYSPETVTLRNREDAANKSLGQIELVISNRDENSPHKLINHIKCKDWDTLDHFRRGDYELIEKVDKETKKMRFVLVLRPNTY